MEYLGWSTWYLGWCTWYLGWHTWYLGDCINLGKAEDGVEVHEWDEVLHQLRAPPKLFLGLTWHVSAKS